jgi:hypothetical protein
LILEIAPVSVDLPPEAPLVQVSMLVSMMLVSMMLVGWLNEKFSPERKKKDGIKESLKCQVCHAQFGDFNLPTSSFRIDSNSCFRYASKRNPPDGVVYWSSRPPKEQKIPGSNPARV